MKLIFLVANVKKKNKFKINVLILQNENSKLENFELIDALNLFNLTKKNFFNLSEFNIDVENLRKKDKNLFYNYIFYFSIRKLPYDFIIPYSNDNYDNENESESSSDESEKNFENLEICKINENNIEIKSINSNINALRSSFSNKDNLYKNFEISLTSPNLKNMSSQKINKISLLNENEFDVNNQNK